MTVVAFCSVRSCAVTTTALAVAATWPQDRPVLLAELDPAGGTIAAACGWPPEPGLVSLAAAARRGGDLGRIWGHVRSLPGGTPVLTAPASADQARAALATLGATLGHLGDQGSDVVADLGRLGPGSPVAEVAWWADRLAVVARAALPDLCSLDAWSEARRAEHPVGLVLVGDGPYGDAEVTEAIGLPVLARLPWSAQAAAALGSGSEKNTRVARSPLLRGARSLVGQLMEGVAEGEEHTVGQGRRVHGRSWRRPLSWPGPAVATNGRAPTETAR